MNDVLDALNYASSHNHVNTETNTENISYSFDPRVVSIPKAKNKTCNFVGRPIIGLPAGDLNEFGQLVGILRSGKDGEVGGKSTSVKEAKEMISQRAPNHFITRYTYFIKYKDLSFTFVSRSSLGNNEYCPAREIYDAGWKEAKLKYPTPGGENKYWSLPKEAKMELTKKRSEYVMKVYRGGLIGDLEIKPATQTLMPFLFMYNANEREDYPLTGQLKFLILPKSLKQKIEKKAHLDYASRKKKKDQDDPYGDAPKLPWLSNGEGWVLKIQSELNAGGQPQYEISYIKQASLKDCVEEIQRDNPDLAPESANAVASLHNVNLQEYFLNPNPEATVWVNGEYKEGGIHEGTRFKSSEEISAGLNEIIAAWEKDQGISGSSSQASAASTKNKPPKKSAADAVRERKEAQRRKAEAEAAEKAAQVEETPEVEPEESLDDILNDEAPVVSDPEPTPEPEPEIGDQSGGSDDPWNDDDIPF